MMLRGRVFGMRARAAAALVLGVALAGCMGGGDEVASIPVPPPAVGPGAGGAPIIEAPTPAEFVSAETMWALRGGLNVAALQCQNGQLMRDYNQLINRHKALLNDAYQAQQAAYRETHGTRWQARHDADMTRMYNGFANVRDRRRFCAAAAGIAADAADMPSPRLAAVAGRMLRALDPDAPALVASAR